MAALREVLAQFGIEVDDKQLVDADQKIDGFIEKIKKVGGAIIGAFAVKEVFEFAEGIAHQIHQVEATAAALGITTEATQQYGYASRAAGMDGEQLLNLMGRLQVSAINSAKATGQGGKAFREMGVKIRDANGHVKAADVLFEDVAEGIKNTVDPAKRAALATELFGRQGRQLLPFLVKGRDGIRAMRAEFDQLGGGFDEEAIEKSKEFEHSMAKVHVVVDGIKGAIVKGLFPVLGWIADKAALIGGFFVKMTKNSNLFRNALIVLAAYLTPLAISMAVAFAPILLATAAVAALILFVDDLITMFEGGESVIGDIIDKIFGKGQSAETIKEVKEAWQSVKEAFVDMWPYVKKVYEAMKWIVDHAAQLGGALGDNAALVDNAVVEGNAVKSGAIKRSGKGLTYEQNVAKQQGAKMLDAQASGQPFTPTEIPASFKGYEKQFLANIAQWATSITSERQSAVMQGMPGIPQMTGAGDINIDMTIQGTNAQPHEIKRAVEDGVRAGTQRQLKSAKYNLTQAGQKP